MEQPIGCSVEAVATMIGCLPTQALAFSPVSIQTQRTQRTQRKRLRVDGNRALVIDVWRGVYRTPVRLWLWSLTLSTTALQISCLRVNFVARPSSAKSPPRKMQL